MELALALEERDRSAEVGRRRHGALSLWSRGHSPPPRRANKVGTRPISSGWQANDYQLVVDAIADQLLDLRESYAAAFTRAATKRFRRYAGLLADVEEGEPST